VQGTAEEVVANAGLITFEATGTDIDTAARRLRHLPGVEAAAVFGQVLHIAGTNRALLETAIKQHGNGALTWTEVGPRLEDVFIHMLAEKETAP
jgi:ABC-2 type transport system ATP-binding protein